LAHENIKPFGGNGGHMQAHGQGTVAAVQNNVARGTVAQAGLPRGIKRNAHGLLVDEADRHVCNECYNYKENKTPNCSNIRFHKRQRFDNHAWDYNQPVFTVGRGGYNGYNRRGAFRHFNGRSGGRFGGRGNVMHAQDGRGRGRGNAHVNAIVDANANGNANTNTNANGNGYANAVN
jgi:hypothetical protein